MHPVFQRFTRSFAIVSALFITVLTTKARGQQSCNNNDYTQCAEPLSLLTDSRLSFVTTKDDLDRVCPNFHEALKCIRAYTRRCMSLDQRRHFKKLFHGTTHMVQQLCKNETYQQEYLTHAPCMKEVDGETRVCLAKFTIAMDNIQNRAELKEKPEQSEAMDIFTYEKRKREAADEGMKSMCCSFQEYMQCSTSATRRVCGPEAEEFGRDFLEKMASSIIDMHCNDYSPRVCGLSSSSSALEQTSLLSLTVLLFLAFLLR